MDKTNLFTANITDWQAWGNTFQSITAFTPLIRFIFTREQLPFAPVENRKPGTNAVFKVGAYIIKIFAPPGLHTNAFGTDINVELFDMRHAAKYGVPAPVYWPMAK